MKDISKLGINHPYLKYALFIFIGLAIAISLIFGALEYNEIQDNIRETEKDDTRKFFERQLYQKVSQLEMLASGIEAFYLGSESVAQEEFEAYSKHVLRNILHVSGIFVIEDGKIIHMYHKFQVYSEPFEQISSEQLSEILTDQIILKFPLTEHNQNIFLSVTPIFFVNPADLALSENYKIKILSQNNPADSVFSISNIDGKISTDNIQFNENSNQILKTNYDTKIINNRTGQSFVLTAVIWDERFDRELRQDLFSYLTLAGLSVFAVLLPILLIRAERYSYKEKIKSLEIEKINKELATIDKEKDEFSAMITHELKTPLVPIIGHTKMLSNKNMIGELNPEQLKSVQVIDKNAKRLEKLISDIMDARKLDIGKMNFDVDDIPLDSFLDSLKPIYQNIITENRIEFTIDNKTNNLHVKADESRLRQVFDNLISNAIKFVPDSGGKISVGVSKENNLLKFSIRDNGSGIPIESQEKLFHKFYQADTSYTRKVQGTGLGLVICKGIIEKMGGKIWFESDGKAGTTFYFWLPIKET